MTTTNPAKSMVSAGKIDPEVIAGDLKAGFGGQSVLGCAIIIAIQHGEVIVRSLHRRHSANSAGPAERLLGFSVSRPGQFGVDFAAAEFR